VSFIGNIIYAALLVFVVIASLSELGVDTTSFAAVIAAAGLAIGLALQGSLSNFAAGFMIIALRPFKIGEYIEGAGTSGTVEDISILTTTLKTPDNKKIIIPNSAITGGNIVNYSAHPAPRGYGLWLRLW
jgi:small conductance mechanosensitive channel